MSRVVTAAQRFALRIKGAVTIVGVHSGAKELLNTKEQKNYVSDIVGCMITKKALEWIGDTVGQKLPLQVYSKKDPHFVAARDGL